MLGGGQARLRKALVASQVAVSLLLLIGAGLFIRTLNNLLAVDIGLKADQLIAFNVDPSLNGYTSDRTKAASQRRCSNGSARRRASRASASATVRILEGNQWSSGDDHRGLHAEGRRERWASGTTP